MRNWIQWFLAAVLLCSCAKPAENTESFIYRNSARGNPTAEQLKKFVVLGSCVGYALKNSQNRAIFSSARHCFGYQVSEWCQGKNPRIAPDIFTTSYQRIGTCQRILMADKSRDIFIFEATIEDQNAFAGSTPLRWASFVPEPGTKLEHFGRPGDSFRNGQLTATSSCNVQTKSAQTRKMDHQAHQRQAAQNGHRQPDLMPFSLFEDETFHYNCTVYGGDSGGPVIIAGSDIVLGQPTDFSPQEFQTKYFGGLLEQNQLAARVNHSAGFYAKFRREFELAQIDIAHSP